MGAAHLQTQQKIVAPHQTVTSVLGVHPERCEWAVCTPKTCHALERLVGCGGMLIAAGLDSPHGSERSNLVAVTQWQAAVVDLR